MTNGLTDKLTEPGSDALSGLSYAPTTKSEESLADALPEDVKDDEKESKAGLEFLPLVVFLAGEDYDFSQGLQRLISESFRGMSFSSQARKNFIKKIQIHLKKIGTAQDYRIEADAAEAKVRMIRGIEASEASAGEIYPNAPWQRVEEVYFKFLLCGHGEPLLTRILECLHSAHERQTPEEVDMGLLTLAQVKDCLNEMTRGLGGHEKDAFIGVYDRLVLALNEKLRFVVSCASGLSVQKPQDKSFPNFSVWSHGVAGSAWIREIERQASYLLSTCTLSELLTVCQLLLIQEGAKSPRMAMDWLNIFLSKTAYGPDGITIEVQGRAHIFSDLIVCFCLRLLRMMNPHGNQKMNLEVAAQSLANAICEEATCDFKTRSVALGQPGSD